MGQTSLTKHGILSNDTPTTYNTTGAGLVQQDKAAQAGSGTLHILPRHHRFGVKVCVGTTSTQRREKKTAWFIKVSSRTSEFNMVAELRISHHDNWATTPLRYNWATTSDAGSTQLRTSEPGISRTTGQRHQTQFSSQRPGGPQGDHRGGAQQGNDISSVSVSCFWLNILIASSPPLIIDHQHAAQHS